jgi:23S rRNA pseudouridine1911/1915/1917 synthase
MAFFRPPSPPTAMHLLHNDNDFVAIIKPAGIGVQPDKTGEQCLLDQAELHLGQSLFVVHRIDRPVSGIVLFAKTKTAAHALSEQFKERGLTKTYLAVVANLPEPTTAELVHYFEKNESKNKSRVYTEDKAGREKGILKYRVLGSSERYHLLEIQLYTGRHHQIRAQLSAIGCPIKGDVKYGAKRGNLDRSIHLHAHKITIKHPTTSELLIFLADIPSGDTVWSAFLDQINNPLVP